MRLKQFIAAATLGAALCAGVPIAASAQQNDGTREVLGRVLGALLGEEEPTEETVVDADQQGTLQQVLADPRRDEDRARDPYRHPAETLDFFQVRPGMTVVDFMPATGWYSRVLIPYLGQSGSYIGLDPQIGDDFGPYWNTYRNTASRLPADARRWVGNEGARVIGLNTDDDISAYAGSADRMLIFREMHNMRRYGWLHDTLVAARTLLKDDGLLGVVQHRAKADAPAAYTLGDKGYQREEDVIALMRAYGFELVARSEINANPADPANWDDGVWMLPPGYRGAEEGSEEYERRKAIGESDRMTLLFRKRQ